MKYIRPLRGYVLVQQSFRKLCFTEFVTFATKTCSLIDKKENDSKTYSRIQKFYTCLQNRHISSSQNSEVCGVLMSYHKMNIYEMNFTLCVLLVYNDNGYVQTLCITRVSALCIKCLHRPIVIINQQYTKGEIHFIYLHYFHVF